jgi:hypothetical protein
MIIATEHPHKAIFLAVSYSALSEYFARHIPTAPTVHKIPVANFDNNTNSAPAYINSGFEVACQLSAPSGISTIDVAASIAPSVPCQSAKLCIAPTPPHSATVKIMIDLIFLSIQYSLTIGIRD